MVDHIGEINEMVSMIEGNTMDDDLLDKIYTYWYGDNED